MKIIDLTGKKYGRWIVLKRQGTLNTHKAYLCRCKCGTKKVIDGNALIHGITKSCGCLRHELLFKDLTGKKFGRWTVKSLNRIGNEAGLRTYWNCLCKCGKSKAVETQSLLKNSSKSCGCLRKEITSARLIARFKIPKIRKQILLNLSKWKYKKGHKISAITRHKMSISQTDEKNAAWKGDYAGYGAIHDWIRKKKGKPKKCVDCGNTDPGLRKLHWSNVDHKYRRNIEDYEARCVSCHKIYDLKNGLVNH